MSVRLLLNTAKIPKLFICDLSKQLVLEVWSVHLFKNSFQIRAGILSFVLLAGIPLSAAELRMASATSVDNTGLLDLLAPIYRSDTGVELKWISVGSGNALKMAENCSVDVVFTHASVAEESYLERKIGLYRVPVMFNDFVLVAHFSLKEKLKNKRLAELLKVIQKEQIKFFTRGDNSATHIKEQGLWRKVLGAIPAQESWYVTTGQGMLATLYITQEYQGATLTDRGTFIKYEANYKGNAPLVIVFEDKNTLKNLYSVIATNPKHCADTNHKEALRFIEWITSDKVKTQISEFRFLDMQPFVPIEKNK